MPLTANLPALHLDYTMPFFQSSDFKKDLKLKTGLGWLSMSRTADLYLNGAHSLTSESAQLFSVRLGAEYSPSKWKSKLIAPYLGLVVLPSFAFTSESSFDHGSTYFGIPLEISSGVRVPVNAMGISLDHAAIDLGITETLGRIAGSNVNGFGVSLGLRVLL